MHPDLQTLITCETHPENHVGPHFCQHTRTGQGTSNLQQDVDQCLKKQSLDSYPKSDLVIPYSEANHHALIALCCTKSACPINMVTDEDYLAEVEMLCPGTGGLYSAPLIPAGIWSFLQSPVDSRGMNFGRKACYFHHSGT